MVFKDNEVKGKARLGVAAYAEALLVIPKVLAINSGFDAQVWGFTFFNHYNNIVVFILFYFFIVGYYRQVAGRIAFECGANWFGFDIGRADQSTGIGHFR